MKRRLNRRGKALLALIVAIIVLMVPGAVYAKDAIGSRIEIQKIDGTAFVVNNKGSKLDALTGVKLSNGESLQTDAGSYVYLSLDDTKVIKLDELSQVKIEKSGKKLRIEVEEGSIFFQVKEKIADDEAMTIDADTMSMSIRGTAGVVSLRRINDEVVSSVELLEGRVDMTYSDVNGADHEFTLWGGESSLHRSGDAGVTRDLIDITEIEGFAAKELTGNDALAAQILEKSGLNSSYAIAHADELIAKDQSYNLDHYADVFVPGSIHSVDRGDKDKNKENKENTNNTNTTGNTENKKTQGNSEASNQDETPGPAPQLTNPQPVTQTPQPNSSSDDSNQNSGGDDGNHDGGNNDGGSGDGGNSGGSTGGGNNDGGSGDGGNSGGGNSGGDQGGDSGSSEEGEKTYYSVTFKAYNAEGELTVIKTQKVEKGGTATPPEVPARDGYTFAGWEPSSLENIQKDKEFVAYYNVTSEGVSVTFYALTEGGIEYVLVKQQIVSYGGSAVPPTDVYVPNGFEIIGWSPSPYEVTADTTSYAQYGTIPDGLQVTLNYKDENGENTQRIVKCTAGCAPTIPELPTVNGYSFSHWENEDGETVDVSKMTVSDNCSLYAVYDKKTRVVLICEGETIDEIYLDRGDTLSILASHITTFYNNRGVSYQEYKYWITGNIVGTSCYSLTELSEVMNSYTIGTEDVIVTIYGYN